MQLSLGSKGLQDGEQFFVDKDRISKAFGYFYE